MTRVLFPLALAYQAGSRVNNILFDCGLRKIRRVSLPVISVGNTAFGGSEKTPLVMHLLSHLLESGFKPALVTRGYRGRWEKSGGILSGGIPTSATWQDTGDEPYMISRNLPQVGIYVGRKRIDSCRKAEQAGFDTIILDDGFQHRQLYRDLDIVLFRSGERMARESFSSLNRADIVLLKKNDDFRTRHRISSRFPKAKVYFYSVVNSGFLSFPDNSPVSPELLKTRKILALCGIARPQRFFSLLEKEGLKPAVSLSFPDHHSYPVSSKNKILQAAKKTETDALLTTEKDVFKLEEIQKAAQVPVYYNKIDLRVEENLYRDLLSVHKDG